MKIYLAPMEGITGEVYRRAYHTFFEPMDKYFTPFLNPNPKGKFSRQEWNEILPENNEGMYTVPQILTNRAEDFIRLARQLKEFGYEEVNLNLGCPSKTVVNRKRGSGFLFYPDELNHFLAEVFDQLDMKISIKTRSGKYDQEEFGELLDIYNQYPLEELILHPRVQQDYYKTLRTGIPSPTPAGTAKILWSIMETFFVRRITKSSIRNFPKQNASCSEEEF